MFRSRLSILLILGALALLFFFTRKKVESSATSTPRTIAPKFLSTQTSYKNDSRSHQNINREDLQRSMSAKISIEQDAYCRLQKADLGIPLDGQLKVVTFSYDADENNEAGFVALVSSSLCPKNGFSKVRMDNLGRIKSVLDCRKMKAEDIALQSGIQGNVEDMPSKGDRRNFAVSGDGFFVTHCDDGIVLQRDGAFEFKSGKLWHGSCEVLNQFGEPIAEDMLKVDERGCAPSGVCLALSNPPETQAKPRDRTSVAVKDEGIAILSNVHIFSNSVEDFSNAQTGPFGPKWEELPVFHPPSSCVR